MMPLRGRRWPTKQLGRRGASLLIYGFMWLISGLPLLFVSPPSLIHVAELRLWAAGFVGSGALAIAAAFRRTPRADRFGFLALTLVVTLWIVYALTTWVLHITVGGVYSVGPVSAIVNILLLVKVNIDAGWSEPMEPVLPFIEESGDE